MTPATRTKPLPTDLPERPVGWKQRMTLHLNLGGGKHSGNYQVIDADGDPMPITYAYQTNRRHPEQAWSGYFIDGDDTLYKSWAELRRAWAAHVQKITTTEKAP